MWSFKGLLALVMLVFAQFIVCGVDAQEAVNLPYVERFDSEDSMDAWSVLNIDDDAYMWQYGVFAAKCRTLKTDGATPQDWFVSPKFNVTEGLQLGFTYSGTFPSDVNQSRFSVYLIEGSPNNYASAIEIFPTTTISNTNIDGTTEAIEVILSLASYEGKQDVYIGFKNESDPYATDIIIDNFILNTLKSVTVNDCKNGTIAPNGTFEIYTGWDKELEFTANIGYFIETLTVNGVDVTADIEGNPYDVSTYTIKGISEDCVVSATFSEAQPEDIPYSTDFSDEDINNKWTIIDANNDGNTWSINPDNSSATISGNTDNDDWLVSPMFRLGDDDIIQVYTTMKRSGTIGLFYVIKDSIQNYINADNKLSGISTSDMSLETTYYDLHKFRGEDIYIAFRSNGRLELDIKSINLAKTTPSDLTIDAYFDDRYSATFSYNNVILKGDAYWSRYAGCYVKELVYEIGASGVSPQLNCIYVSAELDTDKTTIKRTVNSGVNNLISLPFDFDISDIIVNGESVVYGDNLKLYIYDGAKRAAESYDGFTATGWVEIDSGIIPANQGFAIAVNSNYGDTQEVVFSVENKNIYTFDDKTITLNKYPSVANNGIEANWNLFGNPHLRRISKGTGYTMYRYNSTTDSYSEYSSVESPYLNSFTPIFVQGNDNLSSITYNSDGTTVTASATNPINSQAILTINGDEDEAKVFVVDGTSSEYATNEDAMYFGSTGSKVAQIYYIDENGKEIASSVVPDMYSSVAVGYKAVNSGTQSIAITTDMYDSVIYLQDSVTGQSTLMTDGTIYEFESAAGTYNNRFTLTTIGEVTGIESAINSDIKVITTEDGVIVCGAEIGAEIVIYSANGTMLYSDVAASQNEQIELPKTGVVVIVKVGSYTFKCFVAK